MLTLENIALTHYERSREYEKAEEMYEQVMNGFEAHYGKDHEQTKKSANDFKQCLKLSEKRRGQQNCSETTQNK